MLCTQDRRQRRWVDMSTTNWNPNDEPDDEAIFNTANAVNLRVRTMPSTA